MNKNSICYVDGVLIDKTINKYILELSIPYFKNIKSMRDTVKHILNIKRNIPLYINKFILLVPITSGKVTYYINFINVIDTYTKLKMTTIIFRDKTYLNLNISKRIIERMMSNKEKLCDYISLIE